MRADAEEMLTVDPIAVPDVLDADRDVALGASSSGDDSRAQLDRARQELARACYYGQALWHQLDEVRRYLREQVAEGGGEGTASLLRGTDQWTQWAQLFAGVSSVLAGPAGDSGAGESAARLAAQEHGVAVPPLGPPA